MSREPLVSVIVPVYNVKPYLEECVRSILEQTYRSIEVILVDDGSTDGSGAVCDHLALADSRILVLHKANGGPAEARNAGVARCGGEWVAFVDGDDIVSRFYVEVLLGAAMATGAQISSMRGLVTFHDSEDVELLDDREHTRDLSCKVVESTEALRLLLYQTIEAGMYFRIYDRRLLGDNPMPIDVVIGEDLVANCRLLHKAESMAMVDTCQIYAYRQLPTSLVHKPCDHEKAASAYRVAERLYSDVTSWYPELAPAAASRSFSVCRSVFAQLPSKRALSGELTRDRELLWSVLHHHRSAVVRDSNARKRERLAAGIACLGHHPFNLFCKVARKAGLLR